MKIPHKLILLMVLVLIVFWILPHGVPNYDGDTDFCWSYVPAAKGEPDAYRGFFYPLFLRISYSVFGDWTLGGRAISIFAMTLSILPVYLVAGWVGVFLMILSPLFWFCGYHLTTDALFWLLFVGVVWAHRDRRYLMAGIFTGLAFCTRYPGIILLALGFFMPKKYLLRFWGTALGLMIVQISVNIYHGFGLLGNNYAMNVAQKGTGMDVFAVLKNVILFPLRFMVDFWPIAGVLVILGMYELARRKEWALLIMSVGILGMVSMTFYSPRFLMPLMLPVVIGGSMWVKKLWLV